MSVLLWLPTLGIVALAFVPSGRDAPVRFLTLGCMLLQSLLGAVLYHRFDGLQPGLQFATDVPWIESWGVSYRVGLDGLNVLLVTLTVFLGPLIVLGAWSAVTTDIKLFHAMVLF
ncbi:MAG: Fe-S-binding domain-containing protein, partial [Steroidobacteraceae bacterium]